MKAVTAQAFSNLALLKYWGRRDEQLRLPSNNSISVNLSDLVTITSLEPANQDSVIIDGRLQTGLSRDRVVEFLDLAAGPDRQPVKLVSKNTFPAATGLSSSASAFAALATAANQFYQLGLAEKELSILARKGSGSATRSIPAGMVRWQTAKTDEQSYAETIFPAEHWDLRILAVVVSDQTKAVPTSGGHQTAQTSPYFQARMAVIEQREEAMMAALQAQAFDQLGLLVEREMFEFHAIPMTSEPPLLYWFPKTIRLLHLVRAWRDQALPVYATINTGHNVYLLTLPDYQEAVIAELDKLDFVQQVIRNKIGSEAQVVEPI